MSKRKIISKPEFIELDLNIVKNMPTEIFELYQNRENISIQEKALIANFLLAINRKEFTVKKIASILGDKERTFSDQLAANSIQRLEGRNSYYSIPNISNTSYTIPNTSKENIISSSSNIKKIQSNSSVNFQILIEKLQNKIETLETKIETRESEKTIDSTLEIINNKINLLEQKNNEIQEKNNEIQEALDDLLQKKENEINSPFLEFTYKEELPINNVILRSFLLDSTILTMFVEFCKQKGLKQQDCLSQFIFEGIEKYS